MYGLPSALLRLPEEMLSMAPLSCSTNFFGYRKKPYMWHRWFTLLIAWDARSAKYDADGLPYSLLGLLEEMLNMTLMAYPTH